MSTQRRKHLFAAIPVMASAMLLTALTTPATAQSEACVFLQPGSGYVATMTVTFAGETFGPSPQFTAGHTQCLPLPGIEDGSLLSVEVQAIQGETATCTPADLVRSVTLRAPITFYASGTTQNVLCYAPAATPGALGAAGPDDCGEFAPNAVPQGTYQETCVVCRVSGCTLDCRCQNRNGMLQAPTTLNLSNCDASQDIGNENGVLTCTPR